MYHNILNIKVVNKLTSILTLMFILSATFTTSLFSAYNVSFRIAFIIVSSYIFLTLLHKINIQISFVTTLISFGLCYIFLIFSSALNSFCFLLLYKSKSRIPEIPFLFFIGAIQLICTFKIFKISRFQKGIKILARENQSNTGVFISFLLIIFIAFVSTDINNSNFLIRTLTTFLSSLLSIFLLYYWRYRITQTYKEKLRLANEKSLEDEIADKNAEILALQADNKRLSEIVHRDNKLVPAMELAVTEFLQNSADLSTEELNSLGKELSTKLHNMAKERQGILEASHKAALPLPQSGSKAIDSILSYMETRAKAEDITYKINIDDNIQTLISDTTFSEDLHRLLSDLIENAIIATRYSNRPKHILIHLGTLQSHLLLEISDSGIEFDIETYQHFGHERHTTHAEHGGSGIGLTDIWKLKKKYKASLQIYEYPSDSAIYTKKISFVFDRKNHFLLQTYRYKEVTYTLTRGDLYVFPNKSE